MKATNFNNHLLISQQLLWWIRRLEYWRAVFHPFIWLTRFLRFSEISEMVTNILEGLWHDCILPLINLILTNIPSHSSHGGSWKAQGRLYCFSLLLLHRNSWFLSLSWEWIWRLPSWVSWDQGTGLKVVVSVIVGPCEYFLTVIHTGFTVYQMKYHASRVMHHLLSCLPTIPGDGHYWSYSGVTEGSGSLPRQVLAGRWSEREKGEVWGGDGLSWWLRR